MAMKVDLAGKIALVTGSGGFIGRAIALEMAKNGSDIIINDLNDENGRKVVHEIEALGRKAIFIKADVSSVDDMKAMADKTIENFGKIDILVNNAGVNLGRSPIHEFREEDWDRTVAVDLSGIYRCSKPMINHMIQRKYGKIINIGSIVGLVPLRMQCAYAAAKAGMFNLTKAMAIELAPHGILVNAIAPGSISNASFYSDPAKSEAILSHIPLHRSGTPDDVANMALYLASDDSNYVTGSIMVVDGGWTCGFARNW
jgi:NAD(P)-dependent dehydrogenase (short-subunit alcohol dehydrogenase family)